MANSGDFQDESAFSLSMQLQHVFTYANETFKSDQFLWSTRSESHRVTGVHSSISSKAVNTLCQIKRYIIGTNIIWKRSSIILIRKISQDSISLIAS